MSLKSALSHLSYLQSEMSKTDLGSPEWEYYQDLFQAQLSIIFTYKSEVPDLLDYINYVVNNRSIGKPYEGD